MALSQKPQQVAGSQPRMRRCCQMSLSSGTMSSVSLARMSLAIRQESQEEGHEKFETGHSSPPHCAAARINVVNCFVGKVSGVSIYRGEADGAKMWQGVAMVV